MRPITSLILIPLFVLCPIVCGASAPVCSMDFIRAWTDSGVPDRGSDRDCCPGDENDLPRDDDDCLCKGAVQADGPRFDDGDRENLSPSLGCLPFDNSPFHSLPLDALPRSGSLIGWASQVGAGRVRAVLQNFRC
ncbi:hypothetical protein [Tautonia marina]|uniref:hypothetical protein n=1 Tax=Tautonia marina TaxID=2653855 RepID=UPI001260B558|nr:hypothetical protein [Tautonia marina]